MKKLSILGSTGSIGVSTLNVVRHLKDEFSVVALAAGSNIDALEAQAAEFKPALIAVYDESKAKELRKRLPNTQIVSGMDGLIEAATHDEAEMLVSAISGTRGISPTVAAIRAGKDIGLANKEVLVSGGQLVMDLVKRHGVNMLPIDSEHSALFQCLEGRAGNAVRRLILTASGGPFRRSSQEELASLTVEQALNHPTWQMGAKITIDSSTLMNKGLEVIEAHWLFDVPVEQIEVVVHPQSVIHSMVEFEDCSILAQMGAPNMELPIQYALSYPKRMPSLLRPFDFATHSVLNFEQADTERFPCLKIAFMAMREGASYPCYMNAANEVLVHRFLDRQIGWQDIGGRLEKLLEGHRRQQVDSIEEVLAVDHEARAEAATA